MNRAQKTLKSFTHSVEASHIESITELMDDYKSWLRGDVMDKIRDFAKKTLNINSELVGDHDATAEFDLTVDSIETAIRERYNELLVDDGVDNTTSSTVARQYAEAAAAGLKTNNRSVEIDQDRVETFINEIKSKDNIDELSDAVNTFIADTNSIEINTLNSGVRAANKELQTMMDAMKKLDTVASERFNEIAKEMHDVFEKALRSADNEMYEIEQNLIEKYNSMQEHLALRKHRFRAMAETGFMEGYKQGVDDGQSDMEIEPDEAAEDWADGVFGTVFDRKDFLAVADEIFEREVEGSGDNVDTEAEKSLEDWE